MWPGAEETTRSYFAPEDTATTEPMGETPAEEERGTPTPPAWGEPLPAWEQERRSPVSKPGTERYGADLPVALAAAILGASVFLPWYSGPPGYGLSVTAWESGSWGPVILCLAAGSLALVLLRRLGIALSLPVEESLVHEGAGWLSLAGAVMKSRFRPGLEGLLGISYGLWVGIAGAVLLIVVAGRMSPHAPLVMRPGWFRGRAGKLGAAVLVAVIAGSATFGTINSASLLRGTTDGVDARGLVQGRLPDCAEGFPVPKNVHPTQGYENPCQAQLAGEAPSSEVITAFKASLQQAGWLFTASDQGAGSTIFTITKPRCGTLAVVGAEAGTIAVIAFGICPSIGPSPGPTTTSG